MRVLFSSRPAIGHLYPLIPLARAAARAGHDVAFATGEPLRAAMERRGFAAFEAGLSVPQWRRKVTRLGGDQLDPSAYRPFFFGKVFTDMEVPPRLADLRLIVERWRPEMLVHGLAEFAGPLAADLAGIPYVTAAYGPLLQPEIADLAGSVVGRYWKEAGLDPAAGRMCRSLYLDPCPPTLQVPAAAALAGRYPIRPEPPEDADERPAPGWVADLAAQPTVYFTLGTIFNRDLDLIRTVLDGLVRAAVNVIATVGPDLDPELIGRYPDTVRIGRYIPQARVLKRCDLVICHGGAGSIFGALAFGLPLLVLPRGADNFYNGDRVLAAGAGRQLVDVEITPGAVAREVALLLDDQRVRAAAGQIAAEIARMPAAASVLGALQGLLDRRGRRCPPG